MYGTATTVFPYPTTLAPAATPAPVDADWRSKPIVEMSNPELMAIAVCRHPEKLAVPAIVELALRAERGMRK
jgi:hypothetical protein